MHYLTLPGTDLRVSQVALGTMTWGEQNDEAQAHAQLDCAIERGITLIDTAEMYPAPPRAETYGVTETYLGNWLARHGRDGLIVASKVAGPGRRDWIRGGRTDLTRDTIAEALDASLKRLRIDAIDLYQVHWPQRYVPTFGATEFDPAQARGRDGPSIREQVEAMAELVAAGKIRYWGLSNETAWGTGRFRREAEALGVPGPVTVQNSYSLVSRTVDVGLAETLHRESMSLLAYSPLAAGMLTGKYLGGAKPPNARFTSYEGFSTRFRKPLVDEAIERYAALARKRGLKLVELALGYLRSCWFLGAMIVGATSVRQLEENIVAAAVELDADTLSEIAAIQARYPNPAG
jgi:aryl-alcohol dehydrogenase-like predicted oxidoreductase